MPSKDINQRLPNKKSNEKQANSLPDDPENTTNNDAENSAKKEWDDFWSKFKGFDDKATDVSTCIDDYLHGDKK